VAFPVHRRATTTAWRVRSRALTVTSTARVSTRERASSPFWRPGRTTRSASGGTWLARRSTATRRIIRKWEGFGWVVCTIKKVNEDARRTIAGDKVNFFVLYDGEEEEEGPVPHVLESAEYHTTDDADYDSWLLLEAIEEIEAVEEPTAMEEE
jgi:hypothetical protein